MNFLQYSLIALTSYLGLAVGLIIMKASKEEQKSSRKYFLLLQKIILLLTIIFLLYFLKLNLIIFLAVSLIIIVLFIKQYKIKELKESYYLYAIFGIIFYASSNNLNLLLIESFLIFIYGLVTASLLIKFKKKNYLEIMLKHISFLIIALLLFTSSVMS